MERLRTDHRVTVCADAPRATVRAECVGGHEEGRSGDLKAMISKARKVELGWRMLEAHVAAGRGGVDYDAVLLARTDLSYPPPPSTWPGPPRPTRSSSPRARTCPSTTSSPSADRGGSGPTRRPTATARRRRAARAHGKAVPIGDHFCGKLERSLVPAIRSRVPDDKFRRFWFQYWIVRGYQIPYFEEHHDLAYRTWGSPCCWQRLNWAQPAMSLSVLVDLNTTCLVDPNVLGKHDKNSRPARRRPRAVAAQRRQRRARRPPGGGNATVVRFGAVDESGLRVAGRGWGRVLARWRCAKQMKIAVLGGSMTRGGNLAKRHNDKTKAWPARLLSKLRSSLGAGVTLHNACEPASSLGCPGAEVRAGGGWSLRRDRPDKPPGWIVNATATATSELSIVVPAATSGTGRPRYLASYEGMGSVTATFATIDVEKIKCNELICAGDDECAAYAAAPGSKAESLAVVRQFKVACHNHAMVWNPVVVKLRPDPGDRGKFKPSPSSRAKT
ncbi:hypothetical protein SO694_00004655 [Aureococcus anophagefferens]|uniref:Uncharacterized protein n=1 Tax=Aureococcus anophagefferens TaxID=44056 RepID=A0ABR1G9S3_AURAN